MDEGGDNNAFSATAKQHKGSKVNLFKKHGNATTAEGQGSTHKLLQRVRKGLVHGLRSKPARVSKA